MIYKVIRNSLVLGILFSVKKMLDRKLASA